jgi:hypothetical protein
MLFGPANQFRGDYACAGTKLNEWCIRRAFQDCQQGLVA